MMITDGKIVIGNDGGVYSRPLSDDSEDGQWSDLNATLRSWQYYDARAGKLPGGGTQAIGGLQDNGTSVVSNQTSQMSEAAGGDGFDVIVDPQNANKMVGEYTDGTMYSSTDGGHSFFDTVSPTCVGPGHGRRHAEARLRPDRPVRHAGGAGPAERERVGHRRRVRVGQPLPAGTPAAPTTACSWTPVYDTGAGQRGHRAVVRGQRQHHLRRVGRRRR